MLRKAVMEAIGTFFLVLTIGQVVVEPGAGALGPLAIGAVLTVMVYAGGHVSGAHYNPAITLGVWLRGRTTTAELPVYWTAQILGGALAALSVAVLKGGGAPPGAAPDVAGVLLAEFLFTFALVFVVLNVATTRGTEGNSYFGIAIGFTVMAGAYAVGPVSGGVFNPAVAVGVSMLGLSAWSGIWMFLVANFAGGIVAALVFNGLDLGDDKPTTATPAEQPGLRGAAETGG